MWQLLDVIKPIKVHFNRKGWNLPLKTISLHGDLSNLEMVE